MKERRFSALAAAALVLAGEGPSWAQAIQAAALQAPAPVQVPAGLVQLGAASPSLLGQGAMLSYPGPSSLSLPSAAAPSVRITPAQETQLSAAAGTIPLPAAPRDRLAEPMGPSGSQSMVWGRTPAAPVAVLAAPALRPVAESPRPAALAGRTRPVLPSPAAASSEGAKTQESALASAKTTARSVASRDPGVRSAELDKLYDGAAGTLPLPAAPRAGLVEPMGPSGPESQGRSPALLTPAPVADAFNPVDSLPTPVHAILKSRPSRRALIATGIFKFGMEALNITMPLIALSCFGSAVWMATMAAAWGASMTLGSSIGGGLADRKPVQKVLAGAMLAQAALVSAMIGAMMMGLTTPLVLLPLYSASGLAMGVILTARDTIPARLLGRKRTVLSAFNATTHLVYEIAGTVAPLIVGLLIQRYGLVAGLFIHPPVYLLAAIVFYGLKLAPAKPRETKAAPAAPPGEGPTGWRRIVADLREGARIIFGSPEYRWLGFMLVAPMVVHRVVDQMFIPFFANAVLHAAQRSAWMISASNFGELLGAVLLLKTLLDPEARKTPYRWGKLMAAGLLGVWGFVTGSLYIALPLIFAMSMTWAANDLSMTAYFQSRLPQESAGKAVGFLMAVELATIMTASYLLGFVFDLLPAAWAFPALAAAVTVLAAAFVKGRARIKADYWRTHQAAAPGPR